MKILITDAQSRKSFDLYNIFKGKYNYETILGVNRDPRRLSFVFKQKVYLLRNTDFQSFFHDLNKISRAFKDEKIIYIPASEKTTHLFYQYIAENGPSNFKFLLPEYEIFKLCSDKFDFQKFCEEHDLPVPKSYSSADRQFLLKNFNPLVIKPRVGAGSVGLKYVNTPEQLSYLDSINNREVVIQQKVESESKVAGAFFLCFNGRVVSAHTHQRIRTFPESGGVTIYSRSECNKKLITIGSSVLEKLNWNGLAMIEFMYDIHDKNWKIIELNPRIWGSILLSAFNESGIFKNYIKILDDNTIVRSEPKTDVYIRWFFPYEFLNLLQGKIGWREFFAWRFKKTCYINFTYSSVYTAILYQFYFVIRLRTIKRFFLKLRS